MMLGTLRYFGIRHQKKMSFRASTFRPGFNYAQECGKNFISNIFNIFGYSFYIQEHSSWTTRFWFEKRFFTIDLLTFLIFVLYTPKLDLRLLNLIYLCPAYFAKNRYLYLFTKLRINKSH